MNRFQHPLVNSVHLFVTSFLPIEYEDNVDDLTMCTRYGRAELALIRNVADLDVSHVDGDRLTINSQC